MIKTLKTTALLAAVGMFGWTGSASAVGFTVGTTLNINVDGFQVNAAGLPTIGAPPATNPPYSPNGLSFPVVAGNPAGGALGGILGLFGSIAQPPATGGTRTLSTCFTNQDAGNGGSPTTQCDVGRIGQFRAGASSGVFDTPGNGGLLTFNSIGNIKNFAGTDVNFGGPGVPNFIKLFNTSNAANFGGASADFEIDLLPADITSVLTYQPTSTSGFAVQSPGAPAPVGGTFTLRLPSRIRYVGSDPSFTGPTSALATFIYNVTGLTDNGTSPNANGGDTVANDGISNITTVSASFDVFAVEQVPEPSSMAFVGGAAVLAGARFLKRKAK